MRKLVLISLSCMQIFLAKKLLAQERSVTKTNQQWIHYFNQTKLNSQYSISSDGGYRWKDSFSGKSQFIVRSSLKRTFKNKTNVALGATYVGNYNTDKINKIEFRPFQEFGLSNKLGPVDVSHRYRLEERFFKYPKNQQSGYFNLRFRYALEATIPICTISKIDPNRKVTLNIGNEVFANTGSNIQNRFFDQNRTILGTSVPLNKSLGLSLTWLGQFASTSSPTEYTRTNILRLAIKHSIDFS